MNKSKISLWIIVGILCVILIGLGIADYYVPDNCFLNNYIVGVFTTTIGIIITIIAIEIILANTRKQEQNEISRKGIKRIDTVLKSFLESYESAAVMLAYKMDDIENHTVVEKNFPFTNLSELYQTQLYIMEPIYKPKVQLYFERLDRLKEIVLMILFNVDLSNFPDLSILLVKYIEEMEREYPKEAILNLRNIVSQDAKKQKLSETFSEMIATHTGDLPRNTSNLLILATRLYDILNYHVDFISQYNAIISKYDIK